MSNSSRPTGDRNLLFGILALQMDFISKEALIQAMHAWVLDRAKPLDQILVDQGALTSGRRSLLEALVEEHLAHHANDPSRSLAAMPPASEIRKELEQIADADLDASLACLPHTPLTQGDSGSHDSSLGTSTSAGTRFRVLRPHAKGGLGAVFVAMDEELRREVALKEIQARHANHAESRTRFVREAEITGNLEHPGVVPVYGLGEYADGRPFYAMRFIRGQSLQAAIDHFHQADGPGRDPGERTLELRQLLGRFVAVCNTMAYVHSRGVIHRDLKPGNVMLGPYGETLIVDWGLAKVIGQPEGTAGAVEPALATTAGGDSDLTRAGQTLGTPAYMSPEQAAGRLDQLGPASDVYSLGATLYHLLTGQAPFSSSDPGAMLAKVQFGEFLPPHQKNPQVPAALEGICLKAMALNPGVRYGSAKALADDLEGWLADEPVTAHAEPWRARLGRWMRKNKGKVSAAAAGLLVTVTVCVAFLVVAAAIAREFKEQFLRREAEQQRGEAQAQRQEADTQRQLAEEQRSLVRRLLYFSRINMADRAWHDHQMSRMEDILAEHLQAPLGQEDLRGFEWNYLWRMRHSWLLECLGHTGPVHSVVFSPDGHRLASAGSSLSSDGELGEIKIWDAATGQEALAFKGRTRTVRSLAFSPDGRRLASASGAEVKVWDAATGKEIISLKGHTDSVMSVAFSAKGHLASAARDKTVRVWDAATGQELHLLKGHLNSVVSVGFSPDGRRLATASEEGTVKVWDATTGQEALEFKGNNGVAVIVAFSPDGSRLATAGLGGPMELWDAATGQRVLSLKGHTQQVTSLAFSPDSRRLASASWDNTVKVWDATTGQQVNSLQGHTSVIYSVAFSPDGRRLASASGDKTVKMWDTTAAQEAVTIKGPIVGFVNVAFSPDGRRLASDSLLDQAVSVWDANTGKALLSLQGHTQQITSVAFHPDGRRLASASADKTVKVWDATRGNELFTLRKHTGGVTSVAFSPDGSHLASASEDRTVKVWDATSGQELFSLEGHTEEGVTSVCFSPDGRRLASASNDGMVKVWNADTGQEILAWKVSDGMIANLSFSPDGRRLANPSGAAVKIWDATTGQKILSIKAAASSVAFSPDGQRLASASDEEVKLWDAATGQEALSLKEGGSGVAFSPDGRRLASASWLKVRVWDATTDQKTLSLKKKAMMIRQMP